MSIKRSTSFEQSSSHQRQDDHLVIPMSQQQEQQHLQFYWHNDNNNDGSTWTQDDEERILHSWASRTFSATCYKFTIQNDPAARQQPSLYSFLENWQLHTMYNKSQKVLLGITDRRPCVLLTGDDFMFTPPPLAKENHDSNSRYQQARMDYLDDEDNDDDDDDDDDNDDGDTSVGSGIGMDEHLWMLYQPTTPLHVVNVNDDDDDDDDDDNEMDEQEIMVMGRDTTRTIDPPLVSPALVKWYQTVEHSATTSMIQRRPSTILMTTPHHDDYTSTDDHTSTILIPEPDKDDNTTTTTTTTNSSTITTDSETPVVVVLTWRQWLQQGVIFLSQRMVEVAYMVAELAESLATPNITTAMEDATTSSSVTHHHRLLMTHSSYQYGNHSSSSKVIGGGHYIVQLFRVWRVFFLGVETMLHRLFSLDSSSSHTVAILPLVTK